MSRLCYNIDFVETSIVNLLELSQDQWRRKVGETPVSPSDVTSILGSEYQVFVERIITRKCFWLMDGDPGSEFGVGSC